ncbi:hypothetical protein GQ55_1G052500 [Panicum hallii var. hallii]|uniref:Urease accessory protein D n=1 Tax=Panicum hallii var. hallii TaxID=1504633 RepID=A0A2T7F2J6_9POAL|nr:hypothetical protein GQ55_1G052500 [Panicum hallii var. hallii]
MAEAATGAVRVEKVRGRSALTRCFARYPLKLIAPSKVGPASCDAVWLYALTYGGGIVSGDTISCTASVGDGCTAAITTQASTKVYKAVGSKCSEQLLEVLLEQGSNWSLAEQMQEYNVIAMVVLLGPKLKSMQELMQAEVRKLMSGQLRPPTSGGSLYTMRSQPPPRPQRPPLIASCSPFGRTGTGMVARVAAVSTELVYSFLRHHLAALEPFLGASPYAAS